MNIKFWISIFGKDNTFFQNTMPVFKFICVSRCNIAPIDLNK